MPGEPWEESLPGLYGAALKQLKGPPIHFDLERAEVVLAQFQETSLHRGWTLDAVAVMHNHFHLVVRVADDPSPTKILADFKAYGSRALNRRYGTPLSETWWTTNGSKRRLKDDEHWKVAINYVLYKQPNPLVIWSRDLGRLCPKTKRTMVK